MTRAEEGCRKTHRRLLCGAFLMGPREDWGLLLNCNKGTSSVHFIKRSLAAVCLEKGFLVPERTQRL